ncbi:MAG: MBL fold metallo-hydrolase [Proteobacteria bacterium]|nr:MAG: MBL fold metallo-hydrolase [Pseudomonadota bacterium]
MARSSLACLVACALAASGCERFVERQVESTLQRADQSLLESPALHVVLCGTGSPLPDPDRAAACTAVIAGGHFFLVDAGPGSWEQVDLANLPTGALRGVFLTHFHSDHVGDLGEAITQSWIAGRAQPLDVYGPPGVARVVAGFAEALAADVEARVAHHGDAYMPRAAAGAVARETALGDAPNASAVVFDQDGLRVTMFAVDHEPVRPAVGYRFDWKGRSLVVSGDTRKSASVIEHAKGADLLVHEALAASFTERAVATAKRIGMERLAKLAGDIPSYHTTPREAGEVAQAAGVAHLVLSHMVPAPSNFLVRRSFQKDAESAFSGEVTLGEDGMRFLLAPE